MTPATLETDVQPEVPREDAPPPPRSTRRTRTAAKDKPPKAKPPQQPREVTTAAIEEALTVLLTMPAVPCQLFGDEWGKDHFNKTGPQFAKVLAKQSETNPALYRWLSKLADGETLAVLLFTGTMYALPPLMHWGIVPAPDGMKVAFGVPTPPPPPEPQPDEHANGDASNASNGTYDQRPTVDIPLGEPL